MHLLCQCLERCFHCDSQHRWCGMKNESGFFLCILGSESMGGNLVQIYSNRTVSFTNRRGRVTPSGSKPTLQLTNVKGSKLKRNASLVTKKSRSKL